MFRAGPNGTKLVKRNKQWIEIDPQILRWRRKLKLLAEKEALASRKITKARNVEQVRKLETFSNIFYDEPNDGYE